MIPARPARLLPLLFAAACLPKAEVCGNWAVDGDGDGAFGAAEHTCDPPEGAEKEGSVGGEQDCDDGDPLVAPGLSDGEALCDGLDNDCDGVVDEDEVLSTVYLDEDGDGFGGAATETSSCAPLSGTVETTGDCDDADAALSPGAFEICSDEIDQDCDGADACALSGAVELSALVAAGDGWQLGGAAFALLGDVDGDGVEEVAVGVPNVDAVRIVSGASGEVVQTISGETLTDFGAALAAGDFDGDGDTDLAVGAPLAAEGAGEVTIWTGPFFAASLPISSVEGAVGFGAELESWQGETVDGLAASLATENAITDEFNYYICYFEAPSEAISVALATYSGPFTIVGSWSMTLAAAPDGSALAVGYTGGDTPGSVVYSLPYDEDEIVDLIVRTSSTSTQLGASVLLIDLDGSGSLDLLVGAPGEGEVYGLLDRTDSHDIFTPADADMRWTGSAEAAFGAGLAPLGDLDGDGDSEFAIGGADGLWIFPGSAEGFPTDVSDASATLTGFSGPVRALADAGDLDGDGYDDLLVCDGSTVTLLFGGP